MEKNRGIENTVNEARFATLWSITCILAIGQ